MSPFLPGRRAWTRGLMNHHTYWHIPHRQVIPSLSTCTRRPWLTFVVPTEVPADRITQGGGGITPVPLVSPLWVHSWCGKQKGPLLLIEIEFLRCVLEEVKGVCSWNKHKQDRLPCCPCAFRRGFSPPLMFMETRNKLQRQKTRLIRQACSGPILGFYCWPWPLALLDWIAVLPFCSILDRTKKTTTPHFASLDLRVQGKRTKRKGQCLARLLEESESLVVPETLTSTLNHRSRQHAANLSRQAAGRF